MKFYKVFSLALVLLSLTIVAQAQPQTIDQSNTKFPIQTKDGPYPWAKAPVWQTLNVGLYWVGKNNQYCPANGSLNKIPACANAYNPTKPTVIFFHGWEPMSTRMESRPDFYTSYYTGKGWQTNSKDLGKIWRNRGWNIGVFYWNQISDTTYPSQAAAKIWSTKTSQAMWWKKYNPNAINPYYRVEDENACANPNAAMCQPVGELAYQAYVNAMKNYHGNQILLVGHSLGGQLVINVTHRIAENVANGKLSPQLLPRQMVLLDPFFTPSGNVYLNAVGIDNQTLAETYVNDIANKYGIAVSEFLSSDLTVQQNWSTIEHTAALTLYRPWFDPAYREDEKHSDAWLIYFSSLADKPPVSYSKPMNDNDLTQNPYPAISASTPIFNSNGNIHYGVAAAMERGIYFDQDCLHDGKCGEYSPNPAHDGFLQYDYTPAAIVNAIDVSNNGQPVAANSNLPMQLNQLTRFIATPVSAGNTVQRIVLWQSSNPSVAEVFPGGYVKAVGSGTATITAISPTLGNNKPTSLSFQVQVVK